MTGTAETLFHGGAIYTAAADGRRAVPARAGTGAPASAVAVAGGRITAVGGPDLMELAGPKTEVIDLREKALLPGFQDAHVHPAFAGVTMGFSSTR